MYIDKCHEISPFCIILTWDTHILVKIHEESSELKSTSLFYKIYKNCKEKFIKNILSRYDLEPLSPSPLKNKKILFLIKAGYFPRYSFFKFIRNMFFQNVINKYNILGQQFKHGINCNNCMHMYFHVVSSNAFV